MRLSKLLLLLTITCLSFSVGNATPPTIKTTCKQDLKVQSVQAPSIVEVYNSQIGVRELTGNNDGKQVEIYLKSVGLGKGYPWCAAFVKWCYLQAGIKTNINAMALSVNQRQRWVYANNRLIEEPKRGDAFTLYYPSLARIGHTGFYDGRLNTSIYSTVEGNTNGAGSREGNGVYRKYRSFKATYSINKFVTTAKIIHINNCYQYQRKVDTRLIA